MTYHNGNQALVLEHVRHGLETFDALRSATGLDDSQLENALKRLRHSQDIVRVNSRYFPRAHCLLAEVWK